MPFDNTQHIPVLPLRNTVILPGLTLPIRVGRPKSIAAVKKARENGGWIVTVALREDEEGREPTPSALFRVGTLAKLEKVRGTEDAGYQVLVRGDERFRIDSLTEQSGMIVAAGELWKDKSDLDPKVSAALLKSLKDMARNILELLPADTASLKEIVGGIEDLSYLSYLCAGNLEISVIEKQALLEEASLKARVLTLLELMQKSKESLEVQSEIRDKLSHRMGKMQREAILRQHLDAIREELGETDASGERNDYRKKIEEAGMPGEAKKVALEELKRLESLGSNNPEGHVIRSYLDLLCAMPWTKQAKGKIDLDEAARVLDADHYGLDKIKKRMLQHLAVMKLKAASAKLSADRKAGKAPILLLVGPPGVGKTSLGASVARALGRKFVRGSLGGVRDDAEIRGHRRTYIGAMPGRIIQGIKRAGENNPVFMLDEIDKLSRGFQGDPASALLEVLDPEQNVNFLDHYLDVPFDLSNVVFIATANTLETIPGPLLDRMEVIELSGYTTAEKLHIAKNHLIPKVLAEHGLAADQVQLADDALLRTITHYTREAGVRDLQRKIAALFRAATEKVVRAEPGTTIKIELSDLEETLGQERYTFEVAERVAPPGVVTGLAWTPQGGEILFIESSLMPGSGKLILTGQLGDVMKESAQIALSLVRSRLPELLPSFEYDKKDLHIHVPAGAIPKDGPSAGITILTTIASLFSGRSVSPKLAMTGEVTLRGAVMPVGGIKEKVIAAHRAGIERVILSRRNERDLNEVPDEVKRQLKFELVDNVAEVVKIALGIDIAPAFPRLGAPPAPTAAVA